MSSKKDSSSSASSETKSKSRVLKLLLASIFFVGSGIVLAYCGYFAFKQYRAYKVSIAIPTQVSYDKIRSEDLDVLKDASILYCLKETIPFSDQDNKQLRYDWVAGLQKFMDSQDVPNKSNVVFNGNSLIPLMVKHYSAESYEFLKGKIVGIKAIAVSQKSGHDVADILLEIENAPDLEVSLIKDSVDGHWKLDWPQFVRYQSENWNEFFAGKGPEVASFRVYAVREKAYEDNDNYGLVLYKARPNGVEAINQISPPVTVTKKTKAGTDFYKALKLYEFSQEDKTRVFEQFDDKNWIRMQCKIIRIPDINNPGKFLFKISEIIDMGWDGIKEKPEEFVL